MGVPKKLDKNGLDRIEKWKTNNPNRENHKKVAQVPVDLTLLEKTPGVDRFNDVWEVNLDQVRFNPFNGRLVGWSGKAEKLDQDKLANRKKISTHMLDNEHFTANDAKELRRQLKQDGQTQVAVALADGVIIDGNTRLAALMEMGKKTIDVFFLPEDFPMAEALRVEWYYSFHGSFVKPWGPYQRASSILHEVRSIANTKKPTEKDMKDAMKDLELENLLKDVNMGPDRSGKLTYDNGPIHHCKALMEAEIYVKKYNEKVVGKIKHDVDWVDDTADGGPGFSVFMTDVLSTLEHAHNDVSEEKTRKIIHNRLRAHTKGELTMSHIVDAIRPVKTALVKDHDEFLTNIPITAANWSGKTISKTIEEEGDKVIQGAKSKKRSTKTQKKLEAILVKLELIKDKDLKKESKGILKPIVKKIFTKVQHIQKQVK